MRFPFLVVFRMRWRLLRFLLFHCANTLASKQAEITISVTTTAATLAHNQ
jgi:hypothetical protein